MTCALDFYSAFLLGLASSLHCVGMCGGIIAVFAHSMQTARVSLPRKLLLHLSFSLGRVLTYTLLGAVLGFASFYLLNEFVPQVAPYLRLFSGLLIILFGLHLSGYLLPLNSLEAMGKPLWRALSPALKRLMPMDHEFKAAAAGVIWGFLPCGMVYSTLLIAMTAASTSAAASIMLGFGLGTVPMLVLSGLAIGRLQAWLKQKGVRLGLAALVVAYGAWVIASYWLDGTGHTHHLG